jgi:chromosome partitioning protein
MGHVISFFNYKGGVGKTTTIYNLSVMLAKMGKKVLLIDADPQSNLTASIYGMGNKAIYEDSGDSQLELNFEDDKEVTIKNDNIWRDYQKNYFTIYDFLQEQMYGKRSDKPLYKKYYQENNQNYCVDLISGSILSNELERWIYILLVTQNSGDYYKLSNIQNTIKNYAKDYDFVLIDTAPTGVSVICGLFILISDYFIAPVRPDFYSLQAIDNLKIVMKNWVELFKNVDIRATFNGIDLKVKLLGIVLQQAKRYKGFSESTTWWSNLLNERIQNYVSYAIESGRVITKSEFKTVFPQQEPYIISTHCDFAGELRTRIEKLGIPIVNLTLEELTAEQHIKTLTQTLDSYEKLAQDLINNLSKI